MIPNYNAYQLEEVLDSEVILPSFMDEDVYQQDFKNNLSLHWRVNGYLHKRENISILLNEEDFRKWKNLKALNWLLFLVVLAYILFFRNYWLFPFLIVYRFLTSIIVDHWIFITTFSVIVGLSMLFGFHSANFWFMLLSSSLGYLLNKFIAECVDQIIFNKAFCNAHSFWKYYSNKLIFIDPVRVSPGYQKLIKKYPGLIE